MGFAPCTVRSMAGVVLSPSSVSVTPGGEAACTVTIRNASAVVESFVVTVLGDAAAWATVTPATVSLFPGSDGTVDVRFRPPRTSSARAGAVDFAVRVAATQADDSTVEEGTLTVEPFVDLAAHITPRTSEAKRKSKHVVSIDNRGNAPVTVSVSASDPDEALAFEATPSSVTIEPGETGASSIGVAARSGFARGPAQHRPFQATVMPPAGSVHPPITLDANFVQKAGMPSFVPVAVAAAVILIAAAIVVPGLTKGDDKGGTFSLTGAAGATTTIPAASAPGGEADAEAEAEAEVEVTDGGATATTAAPVATAPPRSGGAVAGSGGGQATTATTAASADDPPVTTAPPAAPTAVAASLPKPRASLPVLFPSFEGDTDEEIWKINLDGSGKQKLTNYPQPQWSVGARWNYSGTLITFTHANGPVHAWIMNADGSNQHDATPSCDTNCSQPAFSPDGRLLAYVRQTPGTNTYDIWVADVSAAGVTSNHRALVATSADEQYPAFAPDGRLAFQRNASGWKVVVRVASGTETVVGAGYHPAWSPNNDRLLYSDGNEVWSVKPDGSGAANVSNAPSSAEQWPSFSPDGGRVLFSTTRWDGGQWNVAYAELNGTIVKQLTGGTGRHWWVGWF